MSETPSSGLMLDPYPKIPARVSLSVERAQRWVAAEKVHGAHFAVVCDGERVRPSKRRELLDDDLLDGFFGVSRIWPALAVAAARLALALRGTRNSSAVVTIFGELAGGRYPHPAVPPVPGTEPVQTGVWYAPDLHWLIFDASIESPRGRLWIADHVLRQAAATAGLTCVPKLAEGALNVLRELPAAFPTKIPALFGLPDVENNLAEGYVLKPAGEWEEGIERSRPVGKFKQAAFAEDRRFNGSRPYLPPPQGAAGVPAWIVAQAATLLTPARAAAAVSKTGVNLPVEAIAEEIAQDAADEIAEAVGGLEAAQLDSLERALRPAALALARFDAADRQQTVHSADGPAEPTTTSPAT